MTQYPFDNLTMLLRHCIKKKTIFLYIILIINEYEKTRPATLYDLINPTIWVIWLALIYSAAVLKNFKALELCNTQWSN